MISRGLIQLTEGRSHISGRVQKLFEMKFTQSPLILHYVEVCRRDARHPGFIEPPFYGIGKQKIKG